MPEPVIGAETGLIPGLDGRKMSKSYDNIIPLFAPEKELKKKIMRIITDSKTPEDIADTLALLKKSSESNSIQKPTS